MSIFYTNNIDKIKPGKLKGFFVGWPNKPDRETHLKFKKQFCCLDSFGWRSLCWIYKCNFRQDFLFFYSPFGSFTGISGERYRDRIIKPND